MDGTGLQGLRRIAQVWLRGRLVPGTLIIASGMTGVMCLGMATGRMISNSWGEDDHWSTWSWSGGRRTNWSVQSSGSGERDERAQQPVFSTSSPTPAAGQVQGPSGERHGDDSDEGHQDEAGVLGGDGHGDGSGGHGMSPLSAAPTIRMRDAVNRPTGQVPSGHPSVAGGSGTGSAPIGGGTAGHGGHANSKLSSSYPPIFYARPGESWQEYWRTVEFWLASEGKSLPPEVQGPRLMQQLRERAGKIVQHLTVQEVAAEGGINIIRQTMEKSPIIKILDTKKVDKRRQKFMRLGRLAGESIESFLNRAEIYRRENQSSPDYTVGSKFYIGHLLDAAKLTKRDLALIKAAAGGSLEHEEPVTLALLDLAEQLEGLPHFPIGKGEAMLDNEDKYLVQKGGGVTSSSSGPVVPAGSPSTTGPPRKRRFLNRRRFREALVAIMEGEDPEDTNPEAEEIFAALHNQDPGDDSLDEDDENLETTSGSSAASETGDTPLLEIYAQEYKVRELRKMRQYFTKDKAGGQQPEHVKQWVKKQQETDPGPCFLCGKLGHWSQECPLRKKTPIHASNVVYSANVAFEERNPKRVVADEWDLLASYAQKPARDFEHRVYMVHRETGLMQPSGKPPLPAAPHDLYWTMDELGSKIIVDLGCMRTVAGTTWVNALVRELEGQGRFIKVVKEAESFRFGDGHISKSQYGVVVEVALASLHCMLRISVVSGNCPPLLSKSVCSRLGFMIDTEQHMISSKCLGVLQE